MIEVRLLAFLRLNPNFVDQREIHSNSSDMELLASVLMNSTRSTRDIKELFLATNKKEIAERIAQSLERGHFTVEGFTCFVFWIEGVSRALSHQLVRHRMAWYLQQSQRRVDLSELDMVIPPEVQKNSVALEIMQDVLDYSMEGYNKLLAIGIEREDARYVAPNAITTRLGMKIDGSNLIHLLRLRTDKHAQWEIRELANMVWEEARKICPIMFSEEYKKYWW